MEWDKDRTVEFIEIYRKYPVLWDPKNPEYFNKIRKRDAWEEIAKEMEKPVDECKKKMEYLLAAMRREKMKISKSCGTGKGSDEVYKSGWFAFESMKFLWDKNKPRETISNLEAEGTQELDSALETGQPTDVPFPSTSPDAPENQDKSAPIKSTYIKRPREAAPPSSRKKVARTSQDERLDKAFEILQSASASPATPMDESYFFGNFVASRLREYDSNTRCYIQTAIMSVFSRANEGHYSRHPTSYAPRTTNSTSPTYSGFQSLLRGPGLVNAASASYFNNSPSNSPSISPSPNAEGTMMSQQFRDDSSMDTLHSYHETQHEYVSQKATQRLDEPNYFELNVAEGDRVEEELRPFLQKK